MSETPGPDQAPGDPTGSAPRKKPRRRRRRMSTARLAVVARRWGLAAIIVLTAIGALVQWLLR
ncbi:hypothetical protein ACWKWP_15750 [Agromyces soli]